MGHRGWRRVNEKLLPPPVRTAFYELAMLEARSEMRVRIKARAITPAGSNIRRPIKVRIWPIGDIGHRRHVPIRTNVTRSRIHWPADGNNHAGVSFWRIDAEQHYR